jgi:hypothetical protein
VNVRRFACARCGSPVAFTDTACGRCGVALGYEPERLDFVALDPTDRAERYVVVDDGSARWRCLNAAWGCNWLVAADGRQQWCRSCATTRGRPALEDAPGIEAWSRTECDKRRVLHHVASLGLPIDGLAFELVHVPGEPSVTGHLEGVITIDLTEVDDSHREQLRQAFGEPARTMVGHLRHELGHYYWPLLVTGPGVLEEFRRRFGDERADYRAALEGHRDRTREHWNPRACVSRYAGAHPSEDWAETFAHYLLVRDAMETCDELDLLAPEQLVRLARFDDVVRRWMAIAEQLNAIAASVGTASVYPFTLSDEVVAKLAFVDRCVAAARTTPVVPIDALGGGDRARPNHHPTSRCEAIATGGRCTNAAVGGSSWCASHERG